jgi:hypothetical protein
LSIWEVGVKSHQVKRFAILDESTSEGFLGLETMILVKGTEDYAAIIERAFPDLAFDGPYPNDTADFDWFLICHATDEQQAAIKALLGALAAALFLKDGLDECFALSLHMVLTEDGGFVRTPIAQLVREAKPYDTGWNPGSKEKATKLAALLTDFIRIHPTYSRVPFVAAVPASNPNKPFDLPTFLVEQIAAATGKEVVTASIRKTRPTQPMKSFATLADKAANIKNVFHVEPARVAGKEIILIDDIYQTGTSINEVTGALRAVGVRQVFGLTLTKTIRSL